jgi:hypothetical protein
MFLHFLFFGKFSFPPKKYDFLLCGKKLGEYTPLFPNVKWSILKVEKDTMGKKN